MSAKDRQLLIDIGNTRVKWAWQSKSRALLHGHGAQLLSERLEKLPFLDDRGTVGTAWACNVSKNEHENELAGLVRERLGVELQFARVQRKACGVTAAYANLAHLGVDRWSALIGAHAMGPRSYCIVDAGSTVTMDYLLPSGQHLGGYIAPGREMSLAAMAKGTAQLSSRLKHHSGPFADIRPGIQTTEAIEKGILASQLGLLRIGMGVLEDLGGQAPQLLLTGGGSDRLRATGELPLENAKVVPDLVLRGLAALAVELRAGPE